MKYPCIVFRNGRWYQAGEDVPEKEAIVEEAPLTTEEVVEGVSETPSLPRYTKAQINKMKSDEAKEVAISLGFNAEAVEELTNAELKREIINFLKV